MYEQQRTAASPEPAMQAPRLAAYYEKAGWQAYYDRKWLRAFYLLVRANRRVFHMTWPQALSAALHTVRASMAFAPLENNDLEKAQHYMRAFYQKARRSLGLPTDAATLARLELDYWVVHRQLAVERKRPPHLYNIGPLVDTLQALHTATFGGSLRAMRRSAELRAEAMVAVDRITGGYSVDVAADRREVERCLREAYEVVSADAQERKHEGHDS